MNLSRNRAPSAHPFAPQTGERASTGRAQSSPFGLSARHADSGSGHSSAHLTGQPTAWAQPPHRAGARRWLAWGGLLLVSAGFVLGLTHLFRLRFEAGDIYPAYSSLRADPLGCKALYLALSQLGQARRHVQPLDKLGEGQGTTLFYLGAEPVTLRFTLPEYRHLEAFMHTGGRLVVGLLPSYETVGASWPPATVQGPRPPEPKGNAADELAHLRSVPVTERWKFDFSHAPLRKTDSGRYEPEPAARKVPEALPESIPCHTALFFDRLSPEWRVIYARPGDRAVLIQRPFGRGSLVVCADSYLFSNQALRQDRQSALLAWLVGANRRVLFDERHLGVSEEPGLPALARRYGLQGLGVVLLVLAALFVWKNAVPFLPPEQTLSDGLPKDTVPGRAMASGFLNLLRRTVPADALLGLCLAEWKKSCAPQLPQAKLQQVQAIIDAENAKAPRQRDPVRTYAAIAAVLARRSAHPSPERRPLTPALSPASGGEGVPATAGTGEGEVSRFRDRGRSSQTTGSPHTPERMDVGGRDSI